MNNSPLEFQTSIELLRLAYDRELDQTVLQVHGIFGDDILDRISAPDEAMYRSVNIQLMQVFRFIRTN